MELLFCGADEERSPCVLCYADSFGHAIVNSRVSASVNDAGPLFKKAVADSNAPCQEKALDALIAYLRAADTDAGRHVFLSSSCKVPSKVGVTRILSVRHAKYHKLFQLSEFNHL